MSRLSHALRRIGETPPALPERITVNGVDAVCDPLGGLHLPEHGALIVSDLHLEKGSAFARRGMMLPPYDTLMTLKLLDALIARHDPKVVISLGDSFHDRHGAALMPAAFRAMIEAMARGREWIWITGNHDPDAPAGLPGQSLETLRLGALTFRHAPETGAVPGEIAGHLHPAATVRRRETLVRRACFATDGNRLVMPAFGVTTGGMDLAHRAFSGLFEQARLMAHMLGRDRIYSVRFDRLIA